MRTSCAGYAIRQTETPMMNVRCRLRQFVAAQYAISWHKDPVRCRLASGNRRWLAKCTRPASSRHTNSLNVE